MTTAKKPETFADQFTARLRDIEGRAQAAGSNITRVCKNTGVARATFERWGFRPPQTITKLDELEREVQLIEAMTDAERAVYNRTRLSDEPAAPVAKKKAKPKARARA